MRSGLQRRLKALEERAPAPVELRRPLVPGWLLEEWRAQGLQFDLRNGDSLLSALRTARLGGKNP